VRSEPALRSFDVALVVAGQLANLLAVLGVAALLLARRGRVGRVERQVGALGLGVLSLLAMSRLSGTLATDYNQQRAFVQALVVLAPALGYVLQRLSGARSRPPRTALAVICLLAGVLFCSTLELPSVILGAVDPSGTRMPARISSGSM